MNKDLIKKDYKKKIELLNYYNQKYYDENNPEISDSEFDDLKKNHKKITRPEHWGGVIVHHKTIEFWQGRKNRLHDRIFFTKSAKGKWGYSRLSP